MHVSSGGSDSDSDSSGDRGSSNESDENKLLPRSLFVVGDPDQSIYSWRGAVPENMVSILEDFPGTVTKLHLDCNFTITYLCALCSSFGCC